MSRKPDDWMPLHIGPYLADTTNLTRDQHGAYLLLLMAYWRRGGPLPADDGQLAAMAKASPAEWRKLKPVISPLFVEVDGQWRQKRADEELAKAKERVEGAVAAGKAGAAARWRKHSDSNSDRITEAKRSLCRDDASIPKNQEPRIFSLNDFVVGKKAGVRNGVTIQSPSERLARFQKVIAEGLGRDGYAIVGAASDPASPEFERCLALCKAHAVKIGKGWPHQWPTGSKQLSEQVQ